MAVNVYGTRNMITFFVYNLARNSDFDYSGAGEELGPYADTIHDEVLWLKEEGRI